MEHRRFRRFQLALNCRVWNKAGDVAGCHTVDISRGGALVEIAAMSWNFVPVVGDRLSLAVDLPVNRRFGPRLLKCGGHVIRTTASEAATLRVALQFTTLQFAESDCLPVWRSPSADAQRHTSSFSNSRVAVRPCRY
jgi:PilZ domain